jgi:hypothetical protein
VHLADSFFLYTWMLLYVFSPLLVALFILPSTAAATKGLFRSMIEVCGWKIVWSVLASLLWSMALADINKPGHNISFLSAIILNILLAFSVLLTPLITRALLNGGVSQAANQMGGILLGAAALTPAAMTGNTKLLAKRSIQLARKKIQDLRPNNKTGLTQK